MTLTSLILTVLFYFYRDIDWLNHDMEKTQRKSLSDLPICKIALPMSFPICFSANCEDDFFFFVSGDANGLLKTGNRSWCSHIILGPTIIRNLLIMSWVDFYLDVNHHLCLPPLPSPSHWLPTTSLN